MISILAAYEVKRAVVKSEICFFIRNWNRFKFLNSDNSLRVTPLNIEGKVSFLRIMSRKYTDQDLIIFLLHLNLLQISIRI